MEINELKCIEALISFLASKSDLTEEVRRVFKGTTKFEKTKNNLFNQISINDLLENFDHVQPFSLELFLHTGIVPGIYEEKCQIPQLDSKYFKDYLSFYENLLEALREENYVFDEDNNLFISSEKLETVVPQIWLYHLAEASKKTNFERLFFYSKNKQNNIKDKNELLDYLRHTKTFIVELKGGTPSTDYRTEYSQAEAKTLANIDGKREVKVADIITGFNSNLSPNVRAKISKYKLADAFFLIVQAEQMGRDFYTETLDNQQRYINNWMLDFIHSNEKSKSLTQRFILQASTKKNAEFKVTEEERKQIIIGLFILYINLIKNIPRNYEMVALADFKIEEYISDETQEQLKDLEDIIKRINKSRASQSYIRQDIASTDESVKPLDQVEDEPLIRAKRVEYHQLSERLKLQESIEAACGVKRNQLQNQIRYAQQNSLEELAFDNDQIIALITEAIRRGRIYFKPGTKRLIIELYNEELGKTIFKVSISLDNLVLFIENFNYGLDEFGVPKR